MGVTHPVGWKATGDCLVDQRKQGTPELGATNRLQEADGLWAVRLTRVKTV